MGLTSGARGRRTLWVLVALLAGGCEQPVKTPQEAAQRVLDTSAWMAIAKRCPADVMKTDMRVNGLGPANCEGEGMPGCFTRCKARDVDACYWLAYELQKAKVDDRAAEALYQRACLLGEPSGCTNRAAGMLYVDVVGSETRQCTVRTFEKTCGLDDAWGCTMFGAALHEGTGLRRDDARALAVLGKACEIHENDPSCEAARRLIEQIRNPQPETPAP